MACAPSICRAASLRYRWAVYGLLAVVIVSSVVLSFATNRASSSAKASATPLLREKIPLLHQLAEFESALLLHQLALNKYFAHSVSQERYVFLERTTRADMEDQLKLLNRSAAHAGLVAEINRDYEDILALTPRFNEAMIRMSKSEEEEEVQTVLFDLNIKTKEVRTGIDQLKGDIETSAYRSSESTEVQIDRITELVHAFIYTAAFACIFMIYHVWARFRSEDELAFQAVHDPLTGLPHRRSLEQRLLELDSEPHTLVLGVIDRFERIIIGLGHAHGDRVMQEFAKRLKREAAVHGGEVFRLDGASMAILYKSERTREHPIDILHSLRDRMTGPFMVQAHEMSLSLSLGSVQYPQDTRDAGALLQMADAALQVATAMGGGDLVGYTEALRDQALERLNMEADLRHAIERGELELFFQPQQSLRSDALVGFEALLRWNRPAGQVSPAQFIPLAEETGQIVQIGQWVLEQACAQAARWNSRRGPRTVVAVNISARQFRHPDFLACVQQTILRSGVDPACIELEITESVAMQEPEHVLTLLAELRRLGVALAIDDFGTGYSSLAYLQRYPLSKLKIDQSFVSGLKSDAGTESMVKTLIRLAHQLNLTVIAEGVETEHQRQRLRALGCDEVQGYFYARPLPASAASAFLHARQGEAWQNRSAPEDAFVIEAQAA